MTETPAEPGHQPMVDVDVSDMSAVMTALGFDPPTVRAVVITSAGALGISSSYPPTPFDPPPPVEPDPPVIEE